MIIVAERIQKQNDWMMCPVYHSPVLQCHFTLSSTYATLYMNYRTLVSTPFLEESVQEKVLNAGQLQIDSCNVEIGSLKGRLLWCNNI